MGESAPDEAAGGGPATDAPATDAPAPDGPAPNAPATDAPAPDAPAPDASTADTPALRALAASRIPHRVVRTPPARDAEHSAAMQGIELDALLRTIVVRRGDDDYLFVLVPAGRRFDWPRLRAHLGVSRLSLPDADEARAVTGYERYTITPFGSSRAWPVIADATVAGRPTVAIGGGARGVNVHVSGDELIAALGADVVEVSRPGAETDRPPSGGSSGRPPSGESSDGPPSGGSPARPTAGG